MRSALVRLLLQVLQVYVFSESSAGSAVGTELANGKPGQVDAINARVLARIAVVGSAAAGDGAVDVYFGDTYVGRYYNTSTGTVPLESKDWQTPNLALALAPGEQLGVRIADAGATNVLNVHADLQAVG